mmetsp:Transcript_16617/g.45756  ORF Transcript_16617/g.45756 Transcript_16617/m.45756 type:complete len:270 (+) Transcript_16617:147-956(+)
MLFDAIDQHKYFPILYEGDGRRMGSDNTKWLDQEEMINPFIVTSNASVEIIHFSGGGNQQTQSPSNEISLSRLLQDDQISDNLQLDDFLSSEMSSAASPSSRSTCTSQSRSSNARKRSRSLVSSSWNERFQELIHFRETNDHCFVPHNYPQNPKLSQWVRKQRHQRKRKEKGLHSTLSDERQALLTNTGFIWDSHRAMWQERYQSLELFQMTNGHCNVPSNFHDSSLSNWVKNQRKQYKLFQMGSKTTMNEERINLLNNLGFNWNPRNL